MLGASGCPCTVPPLEHAFTPRLLNRLSSAGLCISTRSVLQGGLMVMWVSSILTAHGSAIN